jgi:hypothetical protein
VGILQELEGTTVCTVGTGHAQPVAWSLPAKRMPYAFSPSLHYSLHASSCTATDATSTYYVTSTYYYSVPAFPTRFVSTGLTLAMFLKAGAFVTRSHTRTSPWSSELNSIS